MLIGKIKFYGESVHIISTAELFISWKIWDSWPISYILDVFELSMSALRDKYMINIAPWGVLNHCINRQKIHEKNEAYFG